MKGSTLQRVILNEGKTEFPLHAITNIGITLDENPYASSERWQVFFTARGSSEKHLIFGGSDKSALAFLRMVMEALEGDVAVIDPLDYRVRAFQAHGELEDDMKYDMNVIFGLPPENNVG